MFAKIFICAIVLQVAFSLPQNEDDEGRIVGGATAAVDEFPYQVAVAFGDYICGGGLIYPNVALTAAHCTQHSQNDRDNAKVRAGSSSFYSGYEVGVFDIYDNPNYGNIGVGSHSVPDYDISILHLAASFTLTSSIQTIPIASYARQSGANCVISGWGNQVAGVHSVSTNALKYVEIPFISNQDCHAYTFYDQEAFTLTDRMVCAGNIYMNGDNTCQGDSGGPLVCDGELVGAVSWAKGCATAGYPSVFTDIFFFKDWINSVTFSINGYN